jgi:uncharacterized membrane protein
VGKIGKRQLACLLIPLLTIAFALRAYRLGYQSLWYDEGASLYFALLDISSIFTSLEYSNPPLYYIFLHFWVKLTGSSEFSARFLSLAFGVLTILLMYKVGERLFDRSTGFLSALLATLSPLYILYSQEARAYMMATFFGLLSSYFLLLILDEEVTKRRRRFFWLGFAAANIIAIHVHYSSLLISAFQGIFFLFACLVKKATSLPEYKKRLLIEGLIVSLGIILAYLPWLRFFIGRQSVVLDYWKGTLPPIGVLKGAFLSFSVGETIAAPISHKIAIGYVITFLLALIILLLHSKKRGGISCSHRLTSGIFLLLYLLVPIALLAALVYRTPKFVPRYLMVASPPFFIIIAGSLINMLRWRRFSLSIAIFCLVFIIVTSAYATYSLYFNPVFNKADFRGVARYIHEHIGPEETIILVSGHFFPVFAYYYGWEGWNPIPPIMFLDLEYTLNYSLAEDLNNILAEKRGVWVVSWQEEVIDPNGFLKMMLNEECNPLPVEASFWLVGLRHYAVPKKVHFSPEPSIQHPIEVNFENKIKLLGYSQEEDMTITLYWQALQELEEDYKLSLRLRDRAGNFWGHLDKRPTTYLYPTKHWKVGEVLFGKHNLPVLPGTPPGHYRVEIGLYSDTDLEGLDVLDVLGNPKGKSAFIGEVKLVKAKHPPTLEELGIRYTLMEDFGGQVALLGYDIVKKRVRPGDVLHLTLFWRALVDIEDDYTLLIRLIGEDGISETWEFPPASEDYPTHLWTIGEVIRGQYKLILPVKTPSGPIALKIALVSEDGELLGECLKLADLEVEALERVFISPDVQFLSGASFGGLVTLVGANISSEVIKPGGTLHLTLYWRALAEMDISYTVFTHLIDAQSRIWAQKDNVPVAGSRPTTGWLPGEVIVDEYELVVEPKAPPGEYVIEVGLYDASDPAFPRLPVLNEEGKPIDDRAVFGPVWVK